MRRILFIALIGIAVRFYYGPIHPVGTDFTAIEELMPQPKPGSGIVTGTGFFIGIGGELITADHVVRDCHRIEIASQSVKPTDAHLLHANHEMDLALLRADVAAQSILQIAGPGSLTDRFALVGYPAGGPLLQPTTATLRLVNDQVTGRRQTDPEAFLYLDGPVKHGNSGGPILDAYGNAVGVILRVADRATAQRYFGLNVAELGMGEGLRVLRAFLQDARYFPPRPRPGDTVSTSIETAGAAIVRVVCWR